MFQINVNLNSASSTESGQDTPQATHLNISYGPDPRQILDIYLPVGRNNSVLKVILLIHEGGWMNGSKETMNSWAGLFIKALPQHVIANMNYRLTTKGSPEDFLNKLTTSPQQSLTWSLKRDYSLEPKFWTLNLIGTSVGGHLWMLYALVGEVSFLCRE